MDGTLVTKRIVRGYRESVYFNATLLVRSLLQINSVESDFTRPIIEDNEILSNNPKGAVVSLLSYYYQFDWPMRVIAGNMLPKNTVKLVDFTITTKNGEIYLGDVEEESFMRLKIGNAGLGTKITLLLNDVDNPSLIYVYIDTDTLTLIEKKSLYEVNEEVNSQIFQLGQQDGCHICGRKDKDTYIPHMLPPLELDAITEKRYYPICPEDYESYKEEIHGMLLSFI